MEYWIGAILYMLVEYWLGKREKDKSNSALELAVSGFKKVIKNGAKNPWE